MVQATDDLQFHANHTGICRNICCVGAESSKIFMMFSLESQSKWLRPGNSPPSTLSAQWSRRGAQPGCEAQSSWTPRAPSAVLGLMDRAALMLKLHCPSKREEGSANNVGIPCSFTLLEEFSHPLFPVPVCKVSSVVSGCLIPYGL